MADRTITGIVTWLKGWFYDKEDIIAKENVLQTQINNKASQSDFNTLSSNVANKLDASDYVVDSALSSSSANPVQNKVINTALSSKADSSDVPLNTSDLVNDGDDGTNPFVSDDDSRLSDARTPTSHTHGYIENDGTVGTSQMTSFYEGNCPLVRGASNGKIIIGAIPTVHVRGSTAYSNIGSSASATQSTINGLIDTAIGSINTSLSGKANSSHTHSSADVTEASALSHIGTSANATQHDVNTAIDSIIGNLTGAEIIKVVTTLPTASASTMNALYLLSSNSQYDIYITVESSGSYAWEKLDDDVLSDLSVDWSDIENIPSTFTPSSHTHGNITNDGKITVSTTVASGDYIVISDASQSSKLNRVSNILASQVVDDNGHPNIGSSADTNQYNINHKIDYKIGQINTSLDGKASKSQVIDWDSLTFVAKADDSTGAITFDYLE